MKYWVYTDTFPHILSPFWVAAESLLLSYSVVNPWTSVMKLHKRSWKPKPLRHLEKKSLDCYKKSCHSVWCSSRSFHKWSFEVHAIITLATFVADQLHSFFVLSSGRVPNHLKCTSREPYPPRNKVALFIKQRGWGSKDLVLAIFIVNYQLPTIFAFS
jgi:hypothetical protein